ncbi:hypothetical protein AAVH_22682 [Aphelenchoides avenae]|nr:hypothetical protein AAVH_22682 [Aphelenchus avenae]
MMKGLESVYICRYTEGITDETMRRCAERGVASLNVLNGGGVTEEALLDFCFSNMPANGDPAVRTLFMKFRETSLSKNFFDKLVKKCLDHMPKPLQSVTLGCVVDTTSYDQMAKTHVSQSWKCTHFQLESSGEKFEIVVRKDSGSSDLVVRKGHVDIEECVPRRYSCK